MYIDIVCSFYNFSDNYAELFPCDNKNANINIKNMAAKVNTHQKSHL